MSRTKSQSRQQSRGSAILLLFLIFGSAVVAGLLFQDYREVPYGWFLTAVWLVVATFTCGFGIIYYAQFILPHHSGENWLEGIAMMLRSATHFGSPESSRQQAIHAAKQTLVNRDALDPAFYNLKAGTTRSHQALAVGKGDSFSRAAGPGFIRLLPGERPIQIVDLRPHVRTEIATANSRDGIPLETKVTVVFQVKQSLQEHEGDNLVYPYDSAAVFWVSQLKTFDQDDTVRTWSEQIAPQAASYMISEIAQYTLDELWQDQSIFNGIQQRIRRQLRSNFDEWGINVLNVSVAPVEMPDQVASQRLENWRAPWQSQIMAESAAVNAEALRRVRVARARAQVEMIESTMQSIEEMRQVQHVSLPEIVTLRVIDVLEDAATKTSSPASLPGQVLVGLAQGAASDPQFHQQTPAPPEVDFNDD